METELETGPKEIPDIVIGDYRLSRALQRMLAEGRRLTSSQELGEDWVFLLLRSERISPNSANLVNKALAIQLSFWLRRFCKSSKLTEYGKW
jgi:hypothetical protein